MKTLTKLLKPKTTIPIPYLHTLLYTTAAAAATPPPPKPPPTSSYYDKLIHDAGRSRDLDHIHHLLIKRINHGCWNTKHTFDFITNTHSSLSLLDDIFHCLITLPKGLPLISAFESFISRLCKLGHIHQALKVLDKMHGDKIKVIPKMYHPVLCTLARKKDVVGLTKLLEGMKEMGVKPDITAYNYLLTVFGDNGEVVSAADLVGKMVREEGLKVDSRTYDAMVIGACRAGKVEGALAVIRAALDDGVKLMYCTYAHVIMALLDDKYYEQAVKFVMCFAGWDRGVDRENFELLGDRLVKLERFEEAKMVADEMGRRGLPMSQNLKDFYQLNGEDTW